METTGALVRGAPEYGSVIRLTPPWQLNFNVCVAAQRSHSQKNTAARDGRVVQMALGTSLQRYSGELMSNRYNRPPRR